MTLALIVRVLAQRLVIVLYAAKNNVFMGKNVLIILIALVQHRAITL